jgi:hypothetical protein
MKSVLLLLASSAMLFIPNCDDDMSPTTSNAPDYVGTWVGTSDSEEEDSVEVTFKISSNNTYTYTATSDEIVEKQSGTWALDGTQITFTSIECQAIDEESEELSETDCDEGFSVDIPDSDTWTLTAGSYGEIELLKE